MFFQRRSTLDLLLVAVAVFVWLRTNKGHKTFIIKFRITWCKAGTRPVGRPIFVQTLIPQCTMICTQLQTVSRPWPRPSVMRKPTEGGGGANTMASYFKATNAIRARLWDTIRKSQWYCMRFVSARCVTLSRVRWYTPKGTIPYTISNIFHRTSIFSYTINYENIVNIVLLLL